MLHDRSDQATACSRNAQGPPSGSTQYTNALGTKGERTPAIARPSARYAVTTSVFEPIVKTSRANTTPQNTPTPVDLSIKGTCSLGEQRQRRDPNEYAHRNEHD